MELRACCLLRRADARRGAVVCMMVTISVDGASLRGCARLKMQCRSVLAGSRAWHQYTHHTHTHTHTHTSAVCSSAAALEQNSCYIAHDDKIRAYV